MFQWPELLSILVVNTLAQAIITTCLKCCSKFSLGSRTQPTQLKPSCPTNAHTLLASSDWAFLPKALLLFSFQFLLLPCPSSSFPWRHLRQVHPSKPPLFPDFLCILCSAMLVLFPYVSDNLFEGTKSRDWEGSKVSTRASTVLTSQQEVNTGQWTHLLMSE